MSVIKSVTTFTLVAFMGLLLACSKRSQETKRYDYASFREGFINPPVHARPKVYWWWLNGNTDTVRMREELRAIKDAGIGGVDIFEIGVPGYTNPGGMIPAGPAFMSEESQRQIRFAVKEASKLGLEIGFNLASSWNAGGTWTRPEHAAKSLYFSSTRVNGPSDQTVTLSFPVIPRTDERSRPLLIRFAADGKPEYYEEVAVLAMPADNNVLDTSRVLNLTPFFDPQKETLSWKVPPGQWHIMRYVCANSGEALKLPSPNSQAPIIDHYDSSATRAHFMYFVGQLKPLLGDFSTTGLKNFYLASYEATGSVWTSTMPQAFKKVNGYEIYKFMPALFRKNIFRQDVYNKFDADYHRTLSHLIINNHYRKGREIANKYGLKITSEAGGPGKPLHNVPVEALAALGSLDVPRGEFWNKHHHYDEDSIDIMWLVKEIAAAANIYQRNLVEEEAFTSFEHWQESPFDLKPLADRAFCEGMNRVVVHGFTHNPKGTGFPGIVYHAGTHYNDKRVWWPKIKPFNEYLSRVSFILQEADFHADVLYYYGDKVPNFVHPKNTKFKVGDGYDYEVINTEILLRDLKMKDGKLALPGGAEFSMLCLESEPEIDPEVLEKLQALVSEGAVILGEKPSAIRTDPRRQVNEETSALIDQLWIKSLEPVKGKIVSGMSPLQMVQALDIGPDFRYDDSESGLLDYVHYKKADLDFYLIRNTVNEWVSRSLEFRQESKTAELWNAVTGTILPAPVCTQRGKYLKIPLTIAPLGSIFVVLRNDSQAATFTSMSHDGDNPPLVLYSKDGIVLLEDGNVRLEGAKPRDVINNVSVQNITGPWQVTFPKGWGAPESEIFEHLISWTESKSDGIKYFSGIATYSKTFNIEGESTQDQRIYLDLGDLEKIGDVWLNDQHLGIVWAKPFHFDVTDVIKAGPNQLKIEVGNTWSNRLTGDAVRNENYTNTNITQQQKLPWSQVPLLRSGLLGPVTVRTLRVVK